MMKMTVIIAPCFVGGNPDNIDASAIISQLAMHVMDLNLVSIDYSGLDTTLNHTFIATFDFGLSSMECNMEIIETEVLMGFI